LHPLLDLTNSYGAKLLWPFTPAWFAWDSSEPVDPGLLLILLVGLLLPALLHLVSDEIGVRTKRRPGQRGALLALVVAALYLTSRALLHERAVTVLGSHIYGQEEPIRTGAFPSFSPLLWRGVVETETAVHNLEVPLWPGTWFDPRAARTHFKPQNSRPLEAAIGSDAGRVFLAFARFPLARVESIGDGFAVQIRDLRFASTPPSAAAVTAFIRLDGSGEVISSILEFEQRSESH
jgi:inner membrane protein